jgi:protein TonB
MTGSITRRLPCAASNRHAVFKKQMKLTPLKVSFYISFLVHGAALSAFYAVRDANADAKPSSAIGDMGAIEIVVEPEPAVVSIFEPQPDAVKIHEPAPESPAIEPVIIPDAKPQVDASETIPTARQDNPATAEVEQPATALNETKDMRMGIAIPPRSSSIVSCLTNPKPAYPLEARRRKEQGLVVLAVVVNEKGCPADVRVIQGSGFLLLDEAAITAVKQWLFDPARVGTMAVRSQVEVPVRFRISS